MDLAICTGSFLLGGVSALLVMGLLLFCLEHPARRPKDNQILKQIAEVLQTLPEGEEGSRSFCGSGNGRLKRLQVSP
jgi:hypothetical protein